MAEQCENAPERECRNSTKIALLVQRVDDLEKGQAREESFRKTYYSDREERIRRDAVLDAKISDIDANVTKLVKRQEEEDSKPNRLLDSIKDKTVWMIVAAVLGAVLVKFGL